MIVRQIQPHEEAAYDSVVTHPVQSWAWGAFREQTGLRVIRLGTFEGKKIQNGITLTVHPIPKWIPLIGGQSVLNAPRCTLIDNQLLAGVVSAGSQFNAIFTKLEPNVWLPVGQDDWSAHLPEAFPEYPLLHPGKTSFAPYSAVIDLGLSDDDLLSRMKQKHRYNIKLAQKNGVEVVEDNSETAFSRYLDLTEETTKRQGFYAHTRNYHTTMWQVLSQSGIAHLMTARYQGEIITTWILFIWKDTLYYPYGASSRDHQNVMANNLMLWEAIQFGKRQNLKTFDLWGTLGPNADETDPWYGFHNFKLGFGPDLIHFAPTMDAVFNPIGYSWFHTVDNARRKSLKWRSSFLNAIRYPV